jgi:D-alanyl-D-alanine carboxypeptidase
MRRVLLLLIPFFSTIFLTISSCSSTRESPVEDELQLILDQGVQEPHGRGVSAAIIFPDQTVWTGTSGISYDTVPIEPDMLFAVGSIKKNFIASLTLQLVEARVLSLDDPWSKWLPPYPHVNSAITLRQLLNHTSGIYNYFDNQKIWDELKKDRSRIWSPEDVLSYIKEPYFEPGEGWRYSNTNYLLLAMIVEKATQSKLSIEFRKRFWQPLGIENAYLSIQEDIPGNLAHVFGDNFNNDGSWQDLTFLPRASHDSITFGTVFMTAEDLVSWCHALFEGKVLQGISMDQMLRFVDHGFLMKKEGYGLGVQRFRRRMGSGETAIGHSGGNIGTTAYMVHLPEHHVSVAVMVNSFDHDAGALTGQLIAAVLRDLGVFGVIPFIEPFFLWSGLISVTIFLIVNILRRRRSRSQL